jgi:hypothetical protein
VAIKLQLDVPSLNRLIGGDSEVELDLRKGIVEYFVKQKLANLLSHDRVGDIMRDVDKKIASVKQAVMSAMEILVSAQLGTLTTATGWQAKTTFTPRPEVLLEMRLHAESAAKAAVINLNADIEALVNKRVEQKVKELVGDTFEQKVQAEITRRIAALSRGEA